MTDLTEALEWYENTESLPTPAMWELQPIVGAARQVVSGTPIRWCEEHDSGMVGSVPVSTCHASLAWLYRSDCRIVDRILINPEEET